jgi:membrane protein implicated in regulation of membrane protease activity
VGATQLLGVEGVVRRPGLVALNGELWRAHTADGSSLVVGEHVRVEQIENDLRLVVGSVPNDNGEEPA